jgi:hypothetical protein
MVTQDVPPRYQGGFLGFLTDVKKTPIANALLEMHMTELGLVFMREFQFNPGRKWRFDYLLVGSQHGKKIAIEIEGAIFTRGRHTRGAGYQRDLEKYNNATAAGFKVYRFSTQDVLQGRAKDFLREHASRDRNAMEIK